MCSRRRFPLCQAFKVPVGEAEVKLAGEATRKPAGLKGVAVDAPAEFVSVRYLVLEGGFCDEVVFSFQHGREGLVEILADEGPVARRPRRDRARLRAALAWDGR